MDDWPDSWEPVTDAVAAAGLERQLRIEASRGHVLYGIPIRAIARGSYTDDVLFALDDESKRVAEVHLTWKDGAENPPWPETELFAGLDVWRDAVRRRPE